MDCADGPSAILAFNDVACVGALSAADHYNLSVLQELSLVGYDDTYLARIRHLSLTSVNNGNFAVGAQAGQVSVATARPGDRCRAGRICTSRR